MRRRILGLAVAAMAVAGSMTLGGPASAGDTTVDAVVTAGSLTISSQPASATLTGAVFNETLPSQATGAFGDVTVSDGRGISLAWSMTASSTNFVGQTDNTKSIPLSAGSPLQFGAVASPTIGPNATSGTCVVEGGSLVAANTGVAIATGANLLTGLTPTTCTFNPDLTLTVPANTPPQTYRGTVTLTVA
ncbi:MAG: hypothetical protein ACRDI0_10420 [Actinomycetota bacterium]